MRYITANDNYTQVLNRGFRCAILQNVYLYIHIWKYFPFIRHRNSCSLGIGRTLINTSYLEPLDWKNIFGITHKHCVLCIAESMNKIHFPVFTV
jgi:hypothetical protein